MPERGENHEEGARRAEKSKQTNQSKQYQEKGEALTVLSQSTARKVRYLQIPGRRKDQCKEQERVKQLKRHPVPAKQP